MNLVLCVEAYFGRLANASIAPILYRDGSSYERLSATWTDERELPSEEDLIAWWDDGGQALVQAWEQAQQVIPQDEIMATLTAQLMDAQDTITELDLGLAMAWGTILDLMDVNSMEAD